LAYTTMRRATLAAFDRALREATGHDDEHVGRTRGGYWKVWKWAPPSAQITRGPE
jgi:hypothetical protein